MANLFPIIYIKLSDNIKDSAIYRYYLSHPQDKELENIMESYLDWTKQTFTFWNCQNFLFACYEKIMQQNLYYLIDEVLGHADEKEKNMICLMAIKNNQYEILDRLALQKFDFNQRPNTMGRDDSFLLHAAKENGLDMVKYLVNNGADFNLAGIPFFEHIFGNQLNDIVDYVLEFDIKQDMLYWGMLAVLKKNRNGAYWAATEFSGDNNFSSTKKSEEINLDLVKKIIDKGLNLNNYSSMIALSLEEMEPKIVQFFIDNGLEIKSSTPLLFACSVNNYELIDYYLKLGVAINEEIFTHVLENSKIKIMEIFIKYNIDFSSTPACNEYDDLVDQMEKLGLSKKILTNLMMKNLNKHNKENEGSVGAIKLSKILEERKLRKQQTQN